MLNYFTHKIASVAASALIALLSYVGYAPAAPVTIIQQAPAVEQSFPSEVQAPILFGASNSVPDTVALFTTSLQSQITAVSTTMTLVSATYNNGASTLASSTYGFIIDEGTSVEEIVLADCTSVNCTNMTRGIDRLTGSSTVTSLQFAHRRGASVKITNAPNLLLINRIVQGVGNFPNPVKYASTIATTTLNSNRLNLASVGLLQDTAFNSAGLANANTTQRGLVQLATDLQNASSTALCSTGAPCVITSSSATSTFNSATAGLKVVVTQNNGKIDSNFLSSVAIASSTTFTSGIPLLNIGKTVWVATTTQQFIVPSGITSVDVQCVAGGGSGGGGGNGGSNYGSGAGGGSGAYIHGVVNVSATSSILITIGAGGASVSGNAAGNVGGDTKFGPFLTAVGGSAGDRLGNVSPSFVTVGGAGGIASTTASTTIISVAGGSGSGSFVNGTLGWAGAGGGSFFGGGGGGCSIAGASCSGLNAISWGAGGGGAISNAASQASGAGQYGACIVTY